MHEDNYQTWISIRKALSSTANSLNWVPKRSGGGGGWPTAAKTGQRFRTMGIHSCIQVVHPMSACIASPRNEFSRTLWNTGLWLGICYLLIQYFRDCPYWLALDNLSDFIRVQCFMLDESMRELKKRVNESECQGSWVMVRTLWSSSSFAVSRAVARASPPRTILKRWNEIAVRCYFDKAYVVISSSISSFLRGLRVSSLSS